MKYRQLTIKMYLMLIISSLLFTSLNAQDLRSNLFREADEAMEKTGANQGALLAPENYEKAMGYYRDAEKAFKDGENLDDIRKKLEAAVAFFVRADEAIKLARVTFVNVMNAREDAMEVGSADFAAEKWQEAEKKFNEAARELEDGDVNDAKKEAAEAETLYREAELDAIKTHYLAETRKLLKKADQLGVEDHAPKTLKKAKELVAKAEKELTENRYDKDFPRSLAKQAKYEVKHALYLAQTIKKLDDEGRTFEDLFLLSEEPLRQIAAEIDIVAQFDNGYGETSKQIMNYISIMQDSVENMNQRLTGLNQELTAMKLEIGEMSAEKSKLEKLMAARQKVNERIDRIEKTFNKNEARVLLTTDNKVIIRLEGLNFAVGQSVIEPKFFGLLKKVQNAINIFPGSKIVIEGHTDSHGSDQLNQKLSQERADAVRAYLLANMSVDASMMQAVGYGESRPIANNETAEGRTNNRRIDIVIHPEL